MGDKMVESMIGYAGDLGKETTEVLADPYNPVNVENVPRRRVFEKWMKKDVDSFC